MGRGGEALPGATLPGAERPRPPPGPGAARGEPGGPDAGRGRGGGQAGSGRRVCVSPGSPRPGRGGGRREKQRAAPGGAVLLTHSPEPQVGREGRRHRPAQPRPPPQATKAGDGEGGGGGTRARAERRLAGNGPPRAARPSRTHHGACPSAADSRPARHQHQLPRPAPLSCDLTARHATPPHPRRT